MTLHVFDELEQGTEQWHDQRRGIVTASVVGKLISVGPPSATTVPCPSCKVEVGPCDSLSRKIPTPLKTVHSERTTAANDMPPVISPADTDEAKRLTRNLAAERISGFTDPTFMSAAMWRGVEDEPRARDVYSGTYAMVDEVGFMTEDRWGFTIGYSPDGLVGDEGLIEVKSRGQGTHVGHVVGGEVPAYNMAQIQCGLLVSGRAWCDYLSFCSGLHLWPKRVYPDPVWHEAIVAAVTRFEQNAADLIDAYTQATTGLAMTERVIELEMSL